MLTNNYFDEITRLLSVVKDAEKDSIDLLAKKIYQAVSNQKCIYIFGCTHAGILAQEAFYRSSGLAIFNPILPPGLTCDVRPITMTSEIERIPHYGTIIAQQNKIQKGDIVVIHSVSGRNPINIDFALEAHQLGAYIACITSLEYSKSVTSRHESGKRLFEICDLTIDNHCPTGDGVLYIDTLGQSIAPASTVIGCSIINALAAQVTEIFLENHQTPPVFLSANLDGGDQHNQSVLATYQNQIKYL
ncbi:MAG: SIS domain-containing protein [Candidatus Merdivicinus sp.]